MSNFQDIDASASPEVQMNENMESLEFAFVYGKRHPVTTALTWGYWGGFWGGFTITASTVTLTNATDNYLVVARATGVISTSTATTNWLNTTDYARAYKLTTAGSVVTVVEDHRAGPYGIYAPPQAYVDTTGVGAAGGSPTAEENLVTFSMPSGTFSAAKKGVRITAWGTTASTIEGKTVALYFGSLAILTTALTVSQAGVWRIVAEVISTGTDTQDYVAQLVQGGATTLVDVEQGTHTQDDGAAITIKCTATVDTADDIKQEGMIIEYLS